MKKNKQSPLRDQKYCCFVVSVFGFWLIYCVLDVESTFIICFSHELQWIFANSHIHHSAQTKTATDVFLINNYQ